MNRLKYLSHWLFHRLDCTICYPSRWQESRGRGLFPALVLYAIILFGGSLLIGIILTILYPNG